MNFDEYQLDHGQLFLTKAFRHDKRQTSLTKHFLSNWVLVQPLERNLCDSRHAQWWIMNKNSRYEIGCCKGRSVSRSLGQRLHGKDDVGAGWYDKRLRSRSYSGHPLVVWSVGLAAAATAAAATAAADQDDEEDKRNADYDSLLHIRHVIPPGKGTWIKRL